MAVSVTRHIKVLAQLPLFLGAFLLGLSGFGVCSDSSSFSGKVETSNQNLDLNSSDGTIVYTPKYIMQSYFEKYESLDDSDYKSFVAQELPFSRCDSLAGYNNAAASALIGLERKLVGEGSHRRISSSLRIRVGAKSEPKISQRNCGGVIVVERLPLGVFADNFELQHLHQRGEYDDISVFGDTNLESPSFLSNQSVVEIHVNIGPEISRNDNEVQIELDLPLHARYAPLSETGYSQIRFGAPDLFLRCSVVVEGESWGRSCLYTIENDAGQSQDSAGIVWNIPCGMYSHSTIVYAFTFFSASLAALLIILLSTRDSSKFS